MRSLELRIPPPILGGATAFLMWLVAWALPSFRLVFPGRVVLTIAVGCLGVLVSLAGVSEFRRARTTVNPMTPNASSSLVTTGIYTVTRNPMYLGFSIILLGWGMSTGLFEGISRENKRGNPTNCSAVGLTWWSAGAIDRPELSRRDASRPAEADGAWDARGGCTVAHARRS